jgi:hypothetical protein
MPVIATIIVGRRVEAPVMEMMAVAVMMAAAVEALVAAIVAMEAAMAVERRRGTKPTAMEAAVTAAVKAPTVETTTAEAATMETSTMATATMAAATVPNLGRHIICCMFRCGHSARTRQRQRFSALLRGERQREDRGRSDSKSTHQSASQISLVHSSNLPDNSNDISCSAAGFIALIAVAPNVTVETPT